MSYFVPRTRIAKKRWRWPLDSQAVGVIAAPTAPRRSRRDPGDEDGKQARFTLQEIFGLMLTPDIRHNVVVEFRILT
jgi:hypothetical protein